MIVIPDDELQVLIKGIVDLLGKGFNFYYIARDFNGVWYAYITRPTETKNGLFSAATGENYYYIFSSYSDDKPCLIQLSSDVLRSNNK